MNRIHLTTVVGLLILCWLLTAFPGGRGAAYAQASVSLRGDADGSGQRQITDAILVLNFLFTGGRAPVCKPLADTNGDGAVNISDPVNLLGFLFLGSAAPPPLSEDELLVCKGLDPAAVARGVKELELADPNGNLFSCSSCHSMEPDKGAEVIRAGHTLLNSLTRPDYKDGESANFLAAVNVCLNDWMAVGDPEHDFEFKPWLETDRRFKDLVAFIKSLQTSDSSPALAFEIVAPAKTGPTTGNATAGCRLFNRACMICHGVDAAGNQFAPSLLDITSLCPEKSDLCLGVDCKPVADKCLDNPDFIRNRIRLSGPNHPDNVYHVPPGSTLAGTVMPFWTKDKLTDNDVEDLTAYILAARQSVRDGNATTCIDPPNPGGNVLRGGELESLLHGVKGKAEELDTRRIRFTGFSYDGGGIEVRVWLYKGDDIRGGRAIGPDIFGRILSDTTFVVELPAEVASESFDHVSVRCVSASQDYGRTTLK